MGAHTADPALRHPAGRPSDGRRADAGPNRGGLRGDPGSSARNSDARRSDDRADEGRDPSPCDAGAHRAAQRPRAGRRAPDRGSGEESAARRLPAHARIDGRGPARGIQARGREAPQGARGAGVPAATRFHRERISSGLPRVGGRHRPARRTGLVRLHGRRLDHHALDAPADSRDRPRGGEADSRRDGAGHARDWLHRRSRRRSSSSSAPTRGSSIRGPRISWPGIARSPSAPTPR